MTPAVLRPTGTVLPLVAAASDTDSVEASGMGLCSDRCNVRGSRKHSVVGGHADAQSLEKKAAMRLPRGM